MGERIQSRREYLGIDRKTVADTLGMTTQAIGHYETGRSQVPAETLPRLAKLLGVTVDWIVGNDEEELDVDERDVLQYYRGMPPQLRPAARAALRAMFREEDEGEGTIGRKSE